tara:strand:+ start:36 stop:215 length:180 start_codon:yes stop_codon:yes gene_type:complete
MGLEKIVPAIALIAVLILVLPNFLRSNSEKKQLFKNLFIWSLIITAVILISFLFSKWIQ